MGDLSDELRRRRSGSSGPDFNGKDSYEHDNQAPENRVHRRGNNRIDSLRNIVRDPRVALLFLIPGLGQTLRVNGRARLEAFHPFNREPTCPPSRPRFGCSVAP